MGNKDPAVLFYTSDFLTGVADLTMEERGQYITLLCMQHQKGHLSEKTICLTVGNVSVDVLKKFKTDDEGLYFNSRMEEESEKRSKYIDSRVENGKKGGRKKTICKPYAKPYGKAKQNHTENDNDNENITINTSKNIPYPLEEFNFSLELEEQILIWLKYKTEKKDKYEPTGFKTLLGKIKKNAEQYGDQAVINLIDESMSSNWKGIVWDKLQKVEKTNVLDEIIREGMKNGSNGNGKNHEANSVAVQGLLQKPR
jgi:hypothetical protein